MARCTDCQTYNIRNGLLGMTDDQLRDLVGNSNTPAGLADQAIGILLARAVAAA